MTDPDQRRADPEQEAEARALAEPLGEEIPEGMRPAEAAQRIEELRTQQGDPE